MPASVTSSAFRKTARGGCRLLKLLIYYVSSKASKATTTTDCLEVTRNKRTVHRNSPECSARSGCCYCFFPKGMISTSLKSFHSTDYKAESLQSHGWTCLVIASPDIVQASPGSNLENNGRYLKRCRRPRPEA